MKIEATASGKTILDYLKEILMKILWRSSPPCRRFQCNLFSKYTFIYDTSRKSSESDDSPEAPMQMFQRAQRCLVLHIIIRRKVLRGIVTPSQLIMHRFIAES